jgi:hypothetical protein
MVADFSRGCASYRIDHLLFATHPAIRRWFHVSPAYPAVLDAAYHFSLLQYPGPSNKL